MPAGVGAGIQNPRVVARLPRHAEPVDHGVQLVDAEVRHRTAGELGRQDPRTAAGQVRRVTGGILPEDERRAADLAETGHGTAQRLIVRLVQVARCLEHQDAAGVRGVTHPNPLGGVGERGLLDDHMLVVRGHPFGHPSVQAVGSGDVDDVDVAAASELVGVAVHDRAIVLERQARGEVAAALVRRSEHAAKPPVALRVGRLNELPRDGAGADDGVVDHRCAPIRVSSTVEMASPASGSTTRPAAALAAAVPPTMA